MHSQDLSPEMKKNKFSRYFIETFHNETTRMKRAKPVFAKCPDNFTRTNNEITVPQLKAAIIVLTILVLSTKRKRIKYCRTNLGPRVCARTYYARTRAGVHHNMRLLVISLDKFIIN